MTSEDFAAGDAVPPDSEVIEVLAADLLQLFNSIDPAPLRDRDLDPRVETFIVEWSQDLPRQKPLALLVRLNRSANETEEAALLRDAVHRFFAERARSSRRRLRRLFHTGRISLAIGLVVLAAFTLVGQVISGATPGGGVGEIVRESLAIGGWVAMWRPLEVFLYDWWPIRADARLFDRLAAMPVGIRYAAATTSPASR